MTEDEGRRDGDQGEGGGKAHRVVTAGVAAGAIAFAIAVFFAYRGMRHDDAFIAYRYASNLGSGEGLVFNRGEKVMGFTSPLHVLVLAPLSRLGPDLLPAAAIALGCLGLAAQGLALWTLLAGTPLVAAVASLAVVAGLAHGQGFLALETNLHAALALWTLALIARGRPASAGACLGLAFLARSDAALLGPIAIAWLWGRSAPDTRVASLKRFLLAAAAVVLPWLIFATAYYGTFLPNTFFSKLGVSRPLPYLASFFGRVVELQPLPGPNVLIVPLLALSGAAFALARQHALLPLLAFGALELVAYARIGPSPDQHWHTYVPALATGVLCCAGVFGWLDASGRSPRERPLQRVLNVAGAVAGLGFVAWLGARTLRDAPQVVSSFWLGGRHRAYVEVAAWLGANVAESEALQANEVGTLGYFSRRRMIDPFGLINATNDFPRNPTLQSFLGIAATYRPGAILVDNLDTGRWLEARTHYRVVKVMPWDRPWSTILVRGPEALRDPARFEELRAALPR